MLGGPEYTTKDGTSNKPSSDHLFHRQIFLQNNVGSLLIITSMMINRPKETNKLRTSATWIKVVKLKMNFNFKYYHLSAIIFCKYT